MNINNQDGIIEGPYILFLLLISAIMTIHLFFLTEDYNKTKLHLEQTLCVKEYLIDLTKITYRVHRLNQILLTTDLFQKLSFLFPGVVIQGLSAEKIKKIVINSQNLLLQKYLWSLNIQKQKGCKIPYNLYQSPFKTIGPKFVRDKNDLTILKSLTSIGIWHTPLVPYELVIKYKSNKNPLTKVNVL